MSLLDKLITLYPTATAHPPPPSTGGIKTTLLHDQNVFHANAN